MSYGYRSTPETLRFQPIPPFIFPYSPFKKEQKTDIKTSCWHCGLGYLDITKYKPSFIIFMFKRKIFSKNCEKILLQSILMWFEPTLTTNFFIFYHYHCFPCVLLMQRGLLIINFSSKNIKFIYYLLLFSIKSLLQLFLNFKGLDFWTIYSYKKLIFWK